MGLAEDLEKLAQLNRSGALSDSQFEEAKTAAIAEASSAGGESLPEGFIENLVSGKKATLGEAANRYVSLQVVMSVVGAIFFLIVLTQMCSMSGGLPFR